MINMLSSSLTTGSSLLINSTSILPQNGVMRILANGMKTGVGLKIESSDVSTGSTFGIRSADNGVADRIFNDGKIINIFVGRQGKHGNVFDIQANFLTSGTILDITKHGSLGGKGRSVKVSGGVGAELEANGLIKHGSVLHVHSNSTDKSSRSLVEIKSTNGLSHRTQILRLVQSAASNANNFTRRPAAGLAIESVLPEALFMRVSSKKQHHGSQLTLSRDRQGNSLSVATAPDAVQNHDSVGRIEFHAFTSNLRQRVGLIESQVESVNAQNVGSKLTFKTSQNMSAILKTRLVITDNTSMTIGDDEAFTILRPERNVDGHGEATIFSSQDGKGNGNKGGDIIMRLGTKVSDARYGTLKFSSSTGSEILSIDDNTTMLNTQKNRCIRWQQISIRYGRPKSCVFVSCLWRHGRYFKNRYFSCNGCACLYRREYENYGCCCR